MPGKYEHVVRCPLSRRQQYLYEEYMGRSSTRAAMGLGGGSQSGSGNFMGMMNVLMQLRKVGNWVGGGKAAMEWQSIKYILGL
jgi:SNF2 family DNA or RNA helicase